MTVTLPLPLADVMALLSSLLAFTAPTPFSTLPEVTLPLVCPLSRGWSVRRNCSINISCMYASYFLQSLYSSLALPVLSIMAQGREPVQFQFIQEYAPPPERPVSQCWFDQPGHIGAQTTLFEYLY